MRFLKRLLGRWLWWHAHNLNDRPDGTCGSILRDGDATANVHNWRGESRRHRQLRAEWHAFPSMRGDLGLRFGAGLTVGSQGSEDDATLYLGLVVVTLYLSCSGFLPRLAGYDDREIQICWHSRALWGSIWAREMEWSARDPWWMHWHFDPTDFLLGSEKCTTELLGEPVAVVVPMPEGVYRGTVQITRREWRRARWPFPVVRVSAQIDMQEGVPVPGKGTTAYNCGEYALFGTGSSEPTPEAAVAQVVKSALETRRRYGGPSWLPEGASARLKP